MTSIFKITYDIWYYLQPDLIIKIFNLFKLDTLDSPVCRWERHLCLLHRWEIISKSFMSGTKTFFIVQCISNTVQDCHVQLCATHGVFRSLPGFRLRWCRNHWWCQQERVRFWYLPIWIVIPLLRVLLSSKVQVCVAPFFVPRASIMAWRLMQKRVVQIFEVILVSLAYGI